MGRPLWFYGEHEKDVQTVISSVSQEALSHSEPVPMVCYGKLDFLKKKTGGGHSSFGKVVYSCEKQDSLRKSCKTAVSFP